MNKTVLIILAFLPACATSVFANAHGIVRSDNAYLLHRSQAALTEVIVHDIFSPPVASRIYLYANIAAFETLVPGQKEYLSLSGSISSMPKLKIDNISGADLGLAAVCSYFLVAGKLVFSEQVLMDSFKVITRQYRLRQPAVYRKSMGIARMVADSILSWADRDHYRQTRSVRRYSILKTEGKWLPTPPGYMAAVEPYWNRMRTLALDSASECRPDPPPAYSVEKASLFYRQAMDVYETVKRLSPAQTEIADFWDCNPFFISTQGHLNYSVKKMSPGAHWIMIAGIVSKSKKASMITSSAAYTLTAIAIYDGFISCWDEKYRSNVLRPETYINAVIDENWKPHLQTPPFPEYISGHSVISMAAAAVLSVVYGENCRFKDISEIGYGAGVRSFSGFRQAALEAGISRLYGGIHYRMAIEKGQEQGEQIGSKVLKKIRLK